VRRRVLGACAVAAGGACEKVCVDARRAARERRERQPGVRQGTGQGCVGVCVARACAVQLVVGDAQNRRRARQSAVACSAEAVRR